VHKILLNNRVMKGWSGGGPTGLFSPVGPPNWPENSAQCI